MIALKLVSAHGIEATIVCDGSHGGQDDYYSVVSVAGQIDDRKIFGIDPLQSFSLGLSLIEKLTTDKRVSMEGTGFPRRIEPMS